MEVHSHTRTERKKWTHYIWEFLMLFLAVFCGFLAENFREGQVDHHRENQYMHSLIQDLNADIRDIDSTLELGVMVAQKLDSIVYFLNQEEPEKNSQSLYRLGLITARVVHVAFNDRTSSQLKNSGNMRLIRNSNLSDSIQYYWVQVRIDEEISQRMLDLLASASDVAVQIFSNKYYEKPDSANPFVRSVKKDAKLVNNDPKLIVQLSNRANGRLIVLYNYLNNLRLTKGMALRLI